MPARRILAFFLCFILGFLSCIGALVGGGYLIYSKVSLDWLDDKGLLPIDPGQYLDPDAEVDLSEMTLQDMVSEVSRLAALSEPITVEALIDRYGLILPASAEKLLPAGLQTVPVGELFSAKGLEHILKNTRVDYILGLLPEGVVSEPAQQALGEKTLFDVVDQKMETLLSGVQLGYLLGVEYEKDGDGSYVPVYADPERPTPIETLATVDLGELLGIVGDGGDLLTIMEKCLGDIAVEMLLSSVVGLGGSGLSSIFGELTVDDVLYYDEASGGYQIDLAKVLDGRRFGELLGYTPTFSEQNPEVILAWHDANGEEVFGLMRALAGITPSMEDGKLPDFEVLAADCKLGDVMGYRPTIDPATGEITAWTDAAEKKIGGIERRVADLMIGDLTGGSFSFTSAFDGLFVGELLGYTKDGDKWLAEGGGEIVGIDRAVANIDLGRLLDPDDDYKVGDALSDLVIGELLGYTKDGDKWLDKGGKELSAIYGVIADLSVGEMTGPSFDLNSVFGDLYLGEMMNYEKCEVGGEIEWWENVGEGSDGKKVTGLAAKLASYTLSGLIEGRIDLSVDGIAGDLMIGEVIGYEPCYTDGVLTDWKDSAGSSVPAGTMRAIAHILVGELGDPAKGIDSVLIGDILGYIKVLSETTDGNGDPVTETVWYERYDAENLSDPAKTKRASGIMAAFAGLSIGDMKDTKKVSDQVQSIKVGDAMGYSYGKYTLHGVEHTGWLMPDESTADPDDLKPVTGTLKTIADKTIGELGDEEQGIESLRIGEVLGYERDPETGIWYEDLAAGILWTNTTMLAIADLTVMELDCTHGNEGLGHVYLGSFLGYTPVYKVDGEGEHILDSDGYPIVDRWTDPDGTEPDGLMAAFADLTLNQIGDHGLVAKMAEEIMLGEAMGFHHNELDDTWYRNLDTQGDSDPSNNVYSDPVTGFMKSIAGKKVKDMDSLMDQLTVADVMSYSPDGRGGYTDSEGDPVTGVMLAIAGMNVSSLDSSIGDIYVGQAMDYTKHPTNGKWYVDPTFSEEADGLMSAFAELKLNDLENPDTVLTTVKGVKVGDALGYTYKDGVWYSVYTETENTPLDGVMKAIADSEIGALETTLNGSYVGDILGYTKADGWWYSEGEVKTSTLVNTICSSTIKELGTTMDSLTVEDVFDENERQSGFLSLIPAGTKLTEAGTEINDIFAKTQMWKFVGYVRSGEGTAESPYVYTPQYDENGKTTGVLVFNEATVTNLDKIDQLLGGSCWKTCTINEFVEYISRVTSLITVPPIP